MTTRRAAVIAAILCIVPSARAGENWTGYEGGNLHQNASAVDIDPGGLKDNAVLWDARFDHPVSCQTTNPGFYGSRNLVCLNGRIAVVAANGAEGFGRPFAYVSILDAASGKVVNCISTTMVTGPRRHQITYPTGNLMEAYDTGIGITVLGWDAETGILFLRNGGDNPGNSAYLPLANQGGYKGSGSQPGVGAYQEFVKSHPDFKDADGNLRRDKEIPCDAKRWLDGDQWDYGSLKPNFNNQPNSTAFFETDPDSGLMAAAVAPSHAQAWGFYLANKHTGLYAKPYRAEYAPGRRVFAKWGGIMVGGGRVFFMGPCDDTGGDGFQTSLFKLDKPDQGLRISACKVAWSDKQDNGGYEGKGKEETASLTEAFNHEFHTPHAPATAEDAESYLEVDAFHRNKAWLIDGGGVWAAWKKTQAGNVELLYCDEKGAKGLDLGVGAGQRGQDLWPHISLTRVGDARIIVYYAGNAMYRKFGGKGWSATAEKPLGPAALAVMNVTSGKGWTYTLNKPDGSGPHASLPPNEAEGYFDRSQMVVAGRHAFVGWIDTAGEGSAILRVLAFDVAAGEPPKPTEWTYDLRIPKAANRRTCVFDMIAVDGVLYVLVTESDTLTSGAHTWTAQRVIAIGAAKARSDG